VLDGLVANNVTVRALSRNPVSAEAPLGVEIVAGDLNEPEKMSRVFEGVNAVFLYAQGKNLLALMERTKQSGIEFKINHY
jgi:uncharacterized protein YbjT (DUF2867 family)